MAKYFVVWEYRNGVVQSLVVTDKNPMLVTIWQWVRMAADVEDIYLEEESSYDLYMVIDYPTTFYQ